MAAITLNPWKSEEDLEASGGLLDSETTDLGKLQDTFLGRENLI